MFLYMVVPELEPLMRFPQSRFAGLLFITVDFCLEVPEVSLHSGQPRGGTRWLYPPWLWKDRGEGERGAVFGSCPVALVGFQEWSRDG